MADNNMMKVTPVGSYVKPMRAEEIEKFDRDNNNERLLEQAIKNAMRGLQWRLPAAVKDKLVAAQKHIEQLQRDINETKVQQAEVLVGELARIK